MPTPCTMERIVTQRNEVIPRVYRLYPAVMSNGIPKVLVGFAFAGAIVFVALSAVSIVKSCAAVPSEIAKGLGQAFQPKITVNKTLALAIGALDSKFELKVGERAIDVVVEKTSETEWMCSSWQNSDTLASARKSRAVHRATQQHLARARLDIRRLRQRRRIACDSSRANS